MPATAVRSTKKASAKAAPGKKSTGKFVIYGTAGGGPGNVDPGFGGFHWWVETPKVYPSALAAMRAIRKANKLAKEAGGYSDDYVAPARVVKRRDGTVEYRVAK